MREARTLKLKKIGIEDIRCRRSITAGMVIEVPGKESSGKAEALADTLKEVFNSRKVVRVNRPVKMAELRIRDLDDSIVSKEVIWAIAKAGGCKEEEISVGEIRQRSSRSLSTIWVRSRLP